MIFPPSLLKLVKLYHLPTSGTPQSYPASADVTTSGAFSPMDAKTLALQDVAYEDPYELLVKRNIDVRVGDKAVIPVEINGSMADTNFYVKKVSSHRYGSMPVKKVYLSAQPQ